METITPIPTSYHWGFENLYKSPLIRTACILTASAFALTRFSWTQKFFSSIPWKPALVLAGITTVIVAKSPKAFKGFCSTIRFTKLDRLVFEFLLVKNVVKNRLGIWEWATEIESGIYLSALPMKEMGFQEWIKGNNIAVLSIVEPFEVETTTLVGKAIGTHDLDATTINSPDFLPLSEENLNAAAQWIQEKRSKSIPVLIHCKSGVGRSASALAAYYILHQNMTADGARKEIAAKRPVVYKKGSSHDKALKALPVPFLV